MSKNNNMPCAACKLLRRRCTPHCIFLPFFPPHQPSDFAAVHRIFGASNVSKMLQEIEMDNRRDAVTSMIYEAKARLRDPVYGCISLIASLQKEVFRLQLQLETALAETMELRAQLLEATLSESDPLQVSASSTDINIQNLHECNIYNSNTIPSIFSHPSNHGLFPGS